MPKVLIAIGAAVVVAAALLAYLLLGSGGQAPVVSDDPAGRQPAGEQQGEAPSQQAGAAPSQPAAEGAAPAPAAQAPAGQAAGQGGPAVVQVKPRAAAAEGTAPAAPAATGSAERPSFDIVRVEKSGETVIAGRAAPDSEVTVTTQDGTALGSARADSAGTWAMVTEKPLPPGSHEIGIEAQDPQGGSQLSDEVVVVVVPERPAARSADQPAAKTVGKSAAATGAAALAAGTPAVTPSSGQQVLAVLTPRQGGGASKVLPQEEEEGLAEGDLVLDSVDYDEAGRAVIGGRASPGTRMRLYLDNRLVGDTVAGADGRWSHAPADPVAEGLHALRVDQVDTNGQVLARVETPFSREPVRVAQAGEAFFIVQPGNSLWRIARRTYGRGMQYAVIYQANQDQIRDPDLIYPGQVFELPKID